MKESSESLKNLNEQLQTKEVELLQLKTEVETQQGTYCTYGCRTAAKYAKLFNYYLLFFPANAFYLDNRVSW